MRATHTCSPVKLIRERNDALKDDGFNIRFKFCEANGGLQLPGRKRHLVWFHSTNRAP